MTHELQKLVASGIGFLFAFGLAAVQIVADNFDVETVVGYGVGAVSTGTVFWLVWTDRKGTTRADMTQEARIAELKDALDEMTEDRDFWRARALKIKPPPHNRAVAADSEPVEVEDVVEGE